MIYHQNERRRIMITNDKCKSLVISNYFLLVLFINNNESTICTVIDCFVTNYTYYFHIPLDTTEQRPSLFTFKPLCFVRFLAMFAHFSFNLIYQSDGIFFSFKGYSLHYLPSFLVIKIIRCPTLFFSCIEHEHKQLDPKQVCWPYKNLFRAEI